MLTFILSAILSASWRIGIYFLYWYRKINLTVKTPLFNRKAVILGTGKESMRIGNLLHQTPEVHFDLIGYIDSENKSNTDKFIGRIKYLNNIIKNHNINEIIIPEQLLKIRELIDLLDEISNTKVNCKLVPKGKKILIGKGMVENLSGVPLLDIELPIFDKIQQFNKRCFDIVLSSLLIIATIPVHLFFLLLKK